MPAERKQRECFVVTKGFDRSRLFQPAVRRRDRQVLPALAPDLVAKRTKRHLDELERYV